MRSFFRLADNKFLIAIVTIFILAAAGISPKAEAQTAAIVLTQTLEESSKVTANVDNVSPSQNTIVNVTVTGPAGAEVKLVCHFKAGDYPYSGVIGADGRTVIPVQVGAASPGYAVVVDVSVISDKKYTTQTMFIPQ